MWVAARASSVNNSSQVGHIYINLADHARQREWRVCVAMNNDDGYAVMTNGMWRVWDLLVIH